MENEQPKQSDKPETVVVPRKWLESAIQGCPCSVRERASGHRLECYAPELQGILDSEPDADTVPELGALTGATPRTDRLAEETRFFPAATRDSKVVWEHARQLERELAREKMKVKIATEPDICDPVSAIQPRVYRKPAECEVACPPQQVCDFCQAQPKDAVSTSGTLDAEDAAYWRHAVATNMIRDGSDGVHMIQGEVSEGRASPSARQERK